MGSVLVVRQRAGHAGCMKRHRSNTGQESGTITGISEVTAERVRLGGDVLNALAFAVAANEETQQKFRTAVLVSLSRIEAFVSAIHGLQIVQGRWRDQIDTAKVEEEAEASGKFISKKATRSAWQCSSTFMDRQRHQAQAAAEGGIGLTGRFECW